VRNLKELWYPAARLYYTRDHCHEHRVPITTRCFSDYSNSGFERGRAVWLAGSAYPNIAAGEFDARREDEISAELVLRPLYGRLFRLSAGRRKRAEMQRLDPALLPGAIASTSRLTKAAQRRFWQRHPPGHAKGLAPKDKP
jgi:hypothetical protein